MFSNSFPRQTHLYGSVDGAEVDRLEDIAVQLGGFVRFEGQPHLDESVRKTLGIVKMKNMTSDMERSETPL